MPDAGKDIEFLQADYTKELPLADQSFDLLVSLYAGLVSEHCRRYLRSGGMLLANASHGDASLAALDPSMHLVAVVSQRNGVYKLETENLDEYLVPVCPEKAMPDAIRASGRGIAYAKPAFAYLFEVADPQT